MTGMYCARQSHLIHQRSVGKVEPAQQRLVALIQLHRCDLAYESNATAATMIRPMTTCCQYDDTCMITNPLVSTPINTAPTTVPPIPPRPPARLVPPITTEAITRSSYPMPPTASAAPSRADNKNPASPASAPTTKYTLVMIAGTSRPFRRAASGLPPTA